MATAAAAAASAAAAAAAVTTAGCSTTTEGIEQPTHAVAVEAVSEQTTIAWLLLLLTSGQTTHAKAAKATK